MTVPKWLIPVLASVAALAVAVSTALFAARFAEPETVIVQPQTIEVPVLAPVDEATSLEEVLAEAGDEVPVSPVVEIRETIDPDSVPEGALPRAFSELLDELDAADDPADVLPPSATDPAAPVGDPCATGAAEESSCPAGTPGTIMALGGDLPPLQVWSAGANDATCPAPEEPGSARFLVQANAPVTIEMRITQGSSRRQTVETTDSQADQWLSDVAAGGEAWIVYCIEIADLIGDLPVHVYLDAIDERGRTATRALVLPVTDGLEVPPTRIHPIGDSTVFVSAAHTRAEVLRVRAVPAPDEGEASCSYASGTFSFPTVRDPSTQELSAEYLAENDFEPAYTRRTNVTFAVPASTRFIVCVGWFPASDSRPSFDWDTPLRVSEYRMTSPDVVAPVIRVSELVLTEDIAEDGIRVRATTENGQFCGYRDFPPYDPSSNNELCDYGALLGRTDAGGALQITTEVDTPEGEAVNHVLLDVGLLSCVDGCSGRSRSYDVPLSKFIRPSRICSDDCRINVGETAGFARLRVTWPASTAGTGAGWQLGDWREGSAIPERSPQPQLDVRAEVELVRTPGVERSFDASTPITVDRAVTAAADLVAYGGIPGLCPRPGGTTHWESTAATTRHVISFTGLCAGTRYEIVLTLVAEDGATSTYRYNREADWSSSFWHGASFGTDGESRDVVVARAGLQTGDPTRVIFIESFDVFVNGYDTRILRGDPAQACWIGDAREYRSGLGRTTIGEAVAVTVRVRLRDATDPQASETPRFPTRCDPDRDWRTLEVVELTGWVSYDEFVAGPTVTITDPDTGYVATVVLTDRL